MEKKYTIFYIDDNADNRTLIQRFLMFEGFEVHTVATGQEGLQQASKILPDLFLIDVNLPDISGYEVIKRLNSQPVTQPIPKVAFSAGGDQEIRGLLSTGPIFFLRKPVDVDTLAEKMTSVIENQQGANSGFVL